VLGIASACIWAALWAVQVAGLNRAKIRDVLAYRNTPWPGVTGDIVFSSALDDVGEVYLAKWENGKWNFFSREDLAIPRGYIPGRGGAPQNTPK
jgi:hypothetical protein